MRGLGGARAPIVVTVAACLVTFAASQATAQILGRDRPERPYRGLFGGGGAPSSVGQSLVAAGAFGVGRTTVPPFVDQAGDASGPRRSDYQGGSASLAYVLDKSRVGIDSSVQTSGRLYSGRTTFVTTGNAGLVWQQPLGARSSIGARGVSSYQPVSVATLFPSLFEGSNATPILDDYLLGVEVDHYVSTSTGIDLHYGLSTRSAVSFDATFSRAFSSQSRPQQDEAGASASYSYELRRGLSVNLGYSMRRWSFRPEMDGAEPGPLRHVRTDSIDAGIGFARTLSFSRRTHLSFSTGSTVASDGRTRRFEVTGDAALSHDLGRSWSSSLSYSRRAGFVGIVGAPMFSDNATASLGGLVTRRVSFDIAAGASKGQVGLTDGNTYWSYHAMAGLGIAVRRWMSVDVGYVQYSYKFDDARFLPAGVGVRSNRRTVQASVNLFAPIFQRMRRSNAAR